MSVIRTVTLGGFAVAIVLGSANIVGGSLYDFLETRRQRSGKQPKSRGRAPMISVMILTHNSAETIEACLESVRKNRQRKHEVIVVDNCSTDRTRTIVKAYAKKYRGQHIRLVAKRRQLESGWPAMAEAFKRYAKGDLIVTAAPDSQFDKEALSAAAKRFSGETTISLAAFNRRPILNQTLAGLTEEFDDVVLAQWNKLLALFNPKYLNGSSAFMYHREFFAQMGRQKQLPSETMARRLIATSLENRGWHAEYAPDAVVVTPAAKSLLDAVMSAAQLRTTNIGYLFRYRKLFSDSQQTKGLTAFLALVLIVSKQLALLMIPTLVTLFIYLAASFSTAALLIFSWVILSLFLFISLWGDTYYGFGAKARLSLQIPIMYALFYIRSFSQLAVVIEMLLMPLRALVSKAFGRSHWPTIKRLKGAAATQ